MIGFSDVDSGITKGDFLSYSKMEVSQVGAISVRSLRINNYFERYVVDNTAKIPAICKSINSGAEISAIVDV